MDGEARSGAKANGPQHVKSKARRGRRVNSIQFPDPSISLIFRGFQPVRQDSSMKGIPMPAAVRTAKPKSAGTLYDVHPGVAMLQKWIGELKEKTGRSLEEWLKLIKKSGPADEQAAIDWLKKEHGHGTNSAWWLVERAVRKPGQASEDTPEEYLKAAAKYVEEMYAGAKAALRPMHDELMRLGKSLGKDVKACPCKTIVPLYRNHVFAQIKPTTRTRIDFGLALAKLMGKKKLPARLIDTGGFQKKDRITHRIEVADASQIDTFVREWAETAYELDA